MSRRTPTLAEQLALEAAEVARRRPTTLYRMFDERGRLLYVGISSRAGHRFAEHADSKPWWSQLASISTTHFVERFDAERAERAAIVAEKPLHNVAGAVRGAAVEGEPVRIRPGEMGTIRPKGVPLKDTEKLDRLSAHASDQHDGPGAIEGATDNRGSVELGAR